MALESGYYEANTAKKVTHWPAPDANGDGEEVWEDEYDAEGNLVGRNQSKDRDGNAIYYYSPPEGFKNVPSRQAGANGVTDNYVKVTDRGGVARDPKSGAALGIRPGTTLVEHADGTASLLTDDYSRKMFELAHRKVDAPPDTTPTRRTKKDAAQSGATKDGA